MRLDEGVQHDPQDGFLHGSYISFAPAGSTEIIHRFCQTGQRGFGVPAAGQTPIDHIADGDFSLVGHGRSLTTTRWINLSQIACQRYSTCLFCPQRPLPRISVAIAR